MLYSKKVMSFVIDITQALNKGKFTLDEADAVVNLLSSQIKHNRDTFEISFIDHHLARTYDAGNEIVSALNHVDGYI